VSENYKQRFCQALRFWSRKGRGIDDDIIEELKQNNIPHKINGLTPHGSKTKQRVVIQKFPDELDCLSCPPSVVASWKRFAITILRNDHTCKYLGLGQTQEQVKRQREIMEKYKNL
jgi:predicted phosphoadenosine phosphosulfate sulfurtransferase